MIPGLASNWKLRPMATAISVGSIPLGIIAFSIGQGSSRAFTIIPGGGFFAHLLGLAFLLGGTTATWALVKGSYTLEAFGLIFIALGAGLYGGGVYIGLGFNGLVAGTMSSVIAIGAVGQIIILFSRGKNVHERRSR